jgi:hypothetical protein
MVQTIETKNLQFVHNSLKRRAPTAAAPSKIEKPQIGLAYLR